ncbi:hypothetical protein KIN20_009171 [Parelaphostrongylus tenuis]|uniref:Uncharacterized protein n=1 Tax=Parelaphostrongylus tenuis TaxID=148309 RepID=A0AAD5M931_PARTN|nr:hypothetical protein KIN20_009171 [Parelaphostrongylus tenuis]
MRGAYNVRSTEIGLLLAVQHDPYLIPDSPFMDVYNVRDVDSKKFRFGGESFGRTSHYFADDVKGKIKQQNQERKVPDH